MHSAGCFLRQARSIDHVTSVRVDADRTENKRRIEEEDRRQDRLYRLQVRYRPGIHRKL